jgi:hypothetical protein
MGKDGGKIAIKMTITMTNSNRQPVLLEVLPEDLRDLISKSKEEN